MNIRRINLCVTTTSLRSAWKNFETLYVDPDTSSSDAEIGFLRVWYSKSSSSSHISSLSLTALLGPVGGHRHDEIFPEMEITEIILAKVSRLCQLSSHRRGFLSRLKIFKSIGHIIWISLAQKTPSYGTKMLHKRAFVKFKISNNFRQNTFKTTKNQ